MDPSDRCEAVVTEVVLLSTSNDTGVEDTKYAFKVALEAAVEEGQLQDYLDSVNPESPIRILNQFGQPT